MLAKSVSLPLAKLLLTRDAARHRRFVPTTPTNGPPSTLMHIFLIAVALSLITMFAWAIPANVAPADRINPAVNSAALRPLSQERHSKVVDSNGKYLGLFPAPAESFVAAANLRYRKHINPNSDNDDLALKKAKRRQLYSVGLTAVRLTLSPLEANELELRSRYP